MNCVFGNVFSGEDVLDLVEQPFGNDRSVSPGENIPCFLDPDQPHIKGVMKNCKQSIDSNVSPVSIAQTESMKFIRQRPQAPKAGRV